MTTPNYYKVEVTQHSPATCTVTAYTSTDVEWDKEDVKPKKSNKDFLFKVGVGAWGFSIGWYFVEAIRLLFNVFQ